MTDTTTPLTARLRLAHDYMDTHDWTQGTEQDPQGRVCLTGAIRLCAPRNGDEYLIREVLRHQGHGADWNDEEGRTRDEVLALLSTVEISDPDLEAAFGPGWEGVVRVVRQAATLTPSQVRTVFTAMDTAWNAALDAAIAAAKNAAEETALLAAAAAARNAAQIAVLPYPAREIAQITAQITAQAEAGHYLITPEQYATLTGPWRTSFPTT